MQDKSSLRAHLRALRREHVEGLPGNIRGLLFLRPPSPVVSLVPESATIGLYSASRFEAPTTGYAKWFHEHGHALALPWFESRHAPMAFRRWNDPYIEDELQSGPFGIAQPPDHAEPVIPDVVFVPLVGFSPSGDRIGQGQGHYDRWLEAHPDVLAIGLAWDCQCTHDIPVEPHDRPLAMVITPTQIFEGAA